jgi:hypothetical protein
MPETICTKREVVLEWDGSYGTDREGMQELSTPVGDGPFLYMRMDFADWVDMGKPRMVTVTIEPGDKLNA